MNLILLLYDFQSFIVVRQKLSLYIHIYVMVGSRMNMIPTTHNIINVLCMLMVKHENQKM